MWALSFTKISLPAVLLLAAISCHKESTTAKEPLKVAAASDLSFAFRDVGEAFTKKTGEQVVFSFGATGLLEKQIAEGAPFDVFAAANVSFVNDAVQAGACLNETKTTYATGHLALFTSDGVAFQPLAVADLTDPRLTKIAIANPDHAPYGKAAKQAMERAGVWDKVLHKVVYGENVQQALQFAQSGNADVALVAFSLATQTRGHATPVPTNLHDPIDQALVVCRRGKAGVQEGAKFVAFVQSSEGHAIMRKFGFLLPGETLATTVPPRKWSSRPSPSRCKSRRWPH